MDDAITHFLQNLDDGCNAWVSTMTTCVHTTIRMSYDELLSWKHPQIHIRIPGQRKNRQRSFRCFYNSVSCVYKDVVIKVFFTNGTIHMTGAKTCERAKQRMLSFVHELSIGAGRDFDVDMTSFHVQLANIVIRMPSLREHKISLRELGRMLAQVPIETSYHPDVYVGLKAKVPLSSGRCITILCFSSASFVVTGLKEASEIQPILEMMQKVCTFATQAKLT